MDTATFIGMLVAIVGCVVGLAGWLSGRDKKLTDDAEWKGSVNQNLKDIKDGVSGIGERIARVEGAVSTLDKQSAIYKEHLERHDSDIQELRQKFEEQEKTA